MTSFEFLFRKKKCVKEKKKLVQDLIPPSGIYIHMCTLYTYTNTYMPRCSPSGSFGPFRFLVLTPVLTPEYTMCSVGVCVFTHIHPHTLPPASQIEKTQRILLSPMSLSVKNDPPRQTASALHRPAEIPFHRLQKPNEQTAHT